MSLVSLYPLLLPITSFILFNLSPTSSYPCLHPITNFILCLHPVTNFILCFHPVTNFILSLASSHQDPHHIIVHETPRMTNSCSTGQWTTDHGVRIWFCVPHDFKNILGGFRVDVWPRQCLFSVPTHPPAQSARALPPSVVSGRLQVCRRRLRYTWLSTDIPGLFIDVPGWSLIPLAGCRCGCRAIYLGVCWYV